jgi:hypothetical protein
MPDEEEQESTIAIDDHKIPAVRVVEARNGMQVLAEIVQEPDLPSSSSDESDNDEQGYLHRDGYWEEEEKMHRLVAGVMAANVFSHLSVHKGWLRFVLIMRCSSDSPVCRCGPPQPAPRPWWPYEGGRRAGGEKRALWGG